MSTELSRIPAATQPGRVAGPETASVSPARAGTFQPGSSVQVSSLPVTAVDTVQPGDDDDASTLDAVEAAKRLRQMKAELADMLLNPMMVSAFLATYAQFMQLVSKATRIAQQSQFQQQIDALREQVEQIKSAAALRFAGALTTATFQIASGVGSMAFVAKSTTESMRANQIMDEAPGGSNQAVPGKPDGIKPGESIEMKEFASGSGQQARNAIGPYEPEEIPAAGRKDRPKALEDMTDEELKRKDLIRSLRSGAAAPHSANAERHLAVARSLPELANGLGSGAGAGLSFAADSHNAQQQEQEVIAKRFESNAAQLSDTLQQVNTMIQGIMDRIDAILTALNQAGQNFRLA